MRPLPHLSATFPFCQPLFAATGSAAALTNTSQVQLLPSLPFVAAAAGLPAPCVPAAARTTAPPRHSPLVTPPLTQPQAHSHHAYPHVHAHTHSHVPGSWQRPAPMSLAPLPSPSPALAALMSIYSGSLSPAHGLTGSHLKEFNALLSVLQAHQLPPPQAQSQPQQLAQPQPQPQLQPTQLPQQQLTSAPAPPARPEPPAKRANSGASAPPDLLQLARAAQMADMGGARGKSSSGKANNSRTSERFMSSFPYRPAGLCDGAPTARSASN